MNLSPGRYFGEKHRWQIALKKHEIPGDRSRQQEKWADDDTNDAAGWVTFALHKHTNVFHFIDFSLQSYSLVRRAHGILGHKVLIAFREDILT